MRVETPERWAEETPRRRWPWLAAACAGLALGCGALLLVSLWSYFDAGGTLGGYGAAADAHVDDASYDRNMAHRAWLAAVVAGAVPLGYACWRAWTARSSTERRRAVTWAAAVVAAVILAGATPAIVHAVA